jgi:pyrimidine operon attenuation protein/uracil phosphoribosyltransferase
MAGAFLAHRIAERIPRDARRAVDLGVLDVQGGGDTIPRWPATPGTATPGSRHDRGPPRRVVDDVINTGWTVKDALAAVWRAGDRCRRGSRC